MQETANKLKRITLKTLHEMLDGMSVELAEKVHLLFMANYIDYSDYDFRDDGQVESYCWCYRDLFELKTKESQEIVNSQLIEFLVKIKMPGGPVFFVQKRVGKGGQLFNCHKFRTMIVKHNGSTVSVAGDSRITPLGAKLRHYKLDELPGLWDVLIGNMSFVGPRPDVPGYADKLVGDDRDVLKLRPGITGSATLKYRLEDEMLADVRRLMYDGRYLPKEQIDGMTDQELAVWYNDNVIYPDKVRLNCYYYRNYSFYKDIQMILCTVFGKKMKYAGEII